MEADVLFFLVAFSVLVVIPLVAILTDHQRKMAQLRVGSRVAGQERIEALERRVAELTALVHEQAITVDSLGAGTRAEPDRIERRVGAGKG